MAYLFFSEALEKAGIPCQLFSSYDTKTKQREDPKKGICNIVQSFDVSSLYPLFLQCA